MASSLGYILMTWATEFGRHAKDKKKKNIKKRKANEESKTIIESISLAVQTEEGICSQCLDYTESISQLEAELKEVGVERKELEVKLSQSKQALNISFEREKKLRDEFESLTLEEAQLRYELDQFRKTLSQKLDERDQAHSERIKLMEQLLEDKGIEWARRNEELQRELRQSLKSSLHDSEREATLVRNLENELNSLHAVIEMRSTENRDLRSFNNELLCRLEHQSWLESELNNSRQRLEEMTLVLQNKMTSERELLELSETLQEQLVRSQNELRSIRQQLENRKYISENNRRISDDVDDLRPHRNQHQKASSGAKRDTPVVIDVREKTESVAWMIQMTPIEKNK